MDSRAVCKRHGVITGSHGSARRLGQQDQGGFAPLKPPTKGSAFGIHDCGLVERGAGNCRENPPGVMAPLSTSP
jgi:hypothetical protein